MSEVGNATRLAAVPEFSVTADTYTITSGMTLAINHGLATTPRQVWLRLRCITAEQGYVAGDEVELPAQVDYSGSTSIGLASNKTQIKIVLQGLPSVSNASTGAPAVITANHWNLVVKTES